MPRSLYPFVEAFAAFRTNLFQKDFLLTWEHGEEELRAVLALAELLKRLHAEGLSTRVFDAGLAISLFRDHSTRTRFSFASAAAALGLSLADLDEQKSQVAHGETVRETANMIGFLAEVIGIRDDMYLGEGHKGMAEVGAALSEGAAEGVLHRRPSVLNLQCDVDHPTQTLADLAWLVRHFGSLEALKGKRIAMSWAHSPSYGKPLSVPQGVIGLMTRFGMEVRLAHPEGYGLLPDVVARAARQAEASSGAFRVMDRMEDAFEGADLVYPKSWAPFQVMQRRTELLRAQDREGLKELERACLAENARHVDWTCDRRRMDLTREGRALYLHCLPADITDVSCAQGEVSREVFEEARLDTYREASYKPFVIAALIFLARLRDPVSRAEALVDRAQPLVF